MSANEPNIPGLFITGTDTGVGKTAVTAALAAAWKSLFRRAAVVKPVQTGGFRAADDLRAPDLDFALAVLGEEPSPAHRRLMNPYCFEPACSPHLAAREAGTRIDMGGIVSGVEQLGAAYHRVLVEGAGGVLVPLNDEQTMRDLMVAVGFPVVLVIRPGLGTLNHTALSLHALRAAGLAIAGLVSVDTAPGPWGDIEKDNLDTLVRREGVAHLGHLPWLDHFDDPCAAAPELARHGREILHRLAHTAVDWLQ